MNAKCLAPAFLLSYQLASQAQQGLLRLPLASGNKPVDCPEKTT